MKKLMNIGMASVLAAFILTAFSQLARADTVTLANHGYDVVSYFEVSKAERGEDTITHDWNGKRWQFTNERHRDLFIANPEKYAPAYDGYCAWAASKGALAPTVPQAWTIVDGRLFLNFDLSIRERWKVRAKQNIAKADANWPRLMPQAN